MFYVRESPTKLHTIACFLSNRCVAGFFYFLRNETEKGGGSTREASISFPSVSCVYFSGAGESKHNVMLVLCLGAVMSLHFLSEGARTLPLPSVVRAPALLPSLLSHTLVRCRGAAAAAFSLCAEAILFSHMWLPTAECIVTSHGGRHYKKRHIRDILGRTKIFSVILMTLL